MRLENIGNVIIFSAALLAILSKGSLSAGQAGLSITSSLQIVGALVWVVRYGNFWFRILLLGEQISNWLGHGTMFGNGRKCSKSHSSWLHRF